jgi:hypothetical protein
MTPTTLNPQELDERPIRVLEVHIDDSPRCVHCRGPAFLLGRC